MAAGGAADAQARFGHSVKGLLTEKVTSCGTDVIALTKQVLKGSRSAEVSGGCRLQGPAQPCRLRSGSGGPARGMLGAVVCGGAGHAGSRSPGDGGHPWDWAGDGHNAARPTAMAVPEGHRRRALGPRVSLAAPGKWWEAGGCLQRMAALQGDRLERCLGPFLCLCALRAGHCTTVLPTSVTWGSRTISLACRSAVRPSRAFRGTQRCCLSLWCARLSFSSWVKLLETW